ncbi:MAG: alkaline phosphatase [Fidelibacterota bacterium]|nr:MAG: alkaline phosphatase [Candidatus Neomarinimicrobiota bacterium]
MGQSKHRSLLILTLVAVLLARSIGQDLPHSIVLVIADGTGIGQHTLSYYHNERYAPVAFQHVGLMATHPSDKAKVTDSAAGSTALATGVKTYKGAIAVDNNRQPLKTVLEYAREKGLATGLVATSTITSATPAAFATHVDSRSRHDEIARQLTQAGVMVLFGGGRKYFQSKAEGGEQDADLLDAMATRGVQVVASLEEPINANRPVVGLFAESGLPPSNEGRQPTTTAMALRALEILESDPDGFFLMVEESQVDWGGHDNDHDYVKGEMASLNYLINALLAYQAAHPQVLVVLVADHETGGLALREGETDNGLVAAWITKSHTGNLVPIFATGPGGEAFDAVVDNTFIGRTLIKYVTSR